MNDTDNQDELIASLDGSELHQLLNSLAHDMANHMLLCGLSANDYKRLKHEPLESKDVYERLGSGPTTASIWKRYRRGDIWRYRFGLSRTLNGDEHFLFKPHDVLHLPKLVQNLAAFFADDGCLPLMVRIELKELAEDLDKFLAARVGCAVTGHDPFGECPVCQSNDGYINIRNQHWFVCDTHRMKWCAGEELFETWKSQTPDDWKRNADRLEGYREVEPVNLSFTEMYD